jgi:hypothetical protein
VAGFYEYGNELSGSLKGGELLGYVSDYWLLKMGCAVKWS